MVLKNPDFRDVDIFKKHQDYVFSEENPRWRRNKSIRRQKKIYWIND